ncbi:zinc-ribbon domain-containing protein [Streptomyces sp. NPDC047928]|uniref:zinc-ribbon domain-containing protein n=1 Tax=unclassified Streptomyces TaxID=2593676 RepID=UPI003724657A
MTPSSCPHCGTPSPDEARFCMSCGRERAAPSGPPPVPAVPPAPGYAPGPLRPSPVGAFAGRAFRGDWAAAARAAAWPVVLLLGLAVALAVPSYGQEQDGGGGEGTVVGWSDRLRIALALLLQAFGGGFELTATATGSPFGGKYGSGYEDGSGSGFGPGYGSGTGSGFGDGGREVLARGAAELGLVPLTVTVLWIGALCLGARILRARGAGVDAAVRVSLVAAAAVLVLGLFARPEVAGVEVTSSAVLAALVALALSLAVTAPILLRDDLARWPAAHPAAWTAVRALGTAVRALGVLVAVGALVGFGAYAATDGVDRDSLLLALPILPNIGIAVLGLSWGVPVTYDIQGRFGLFGSGAEHGGVGLPEIGDELGAWPVAGLVALGVAGALTLGLWAARRSPGDRWAQALTGGFFLALYLTLTGASGVSARVAGSVEGLGGDGGFEVAPRAADALLFGLLWVTAAICAGWWLLGRRAARAPKPSPDGPVPPRAMAPPWDAVPTGAMVPSDAVLPDAVPSGAMSRPGAVPPTAPGRRRALLWVVAALVAFVVGGGTTAGVLVLTERRSSEPGIALLPDPDGNQSPNPDADPTASPFAPDTAAPPTTAPSRAGDPAPGPATSAGTTPAPTAGPGGGQGADPAVPPGFRLVADTAGFAFAVPTLWDRVSERQGQITYAGSTGMAHLLVGVVHDAPYTSLDNLRSLEANSRRNNADYRRLRLEANTFQGRPGAIWEYTYKDKAGETVHAVDQAYIAEDGTEYAVYYTDRERNWSVTSETFDVALATWTLHDVD